MRTSRSGRPVVRTYKEEDDDDDDDDEIIQPRRRADRKVSMDGFVVNDEGDADEDEDTAFRANGGSRRSSSRLKRASSTSKVASLAAKRSGSRRKAQLSSDYEDNGEAVLSGDEDEEEEDDDDEGEPEDEDEDSDEAGPRSYSLRRRTKKVDYRLVPPALPTRDGFGRKVPRGRSRSGQGTGPSYELDGMETLKSMAGLSKGASGKARENWNGLPLSMSGKDYEKYFGVDNDDDSSDDDIPASRKTGAAPTALLGGGPAAAGGMLGAGGAAAGGALGPDLGVNRDALGRMKGSAEMADIDPLGVNMQVDFNSVGGLDNHIQQLKEMVSLPLLYPEVFQRFKVTPPRGVLFHGPPGTGKTLVARALAASCSSSGQQISFFMRKGADCLSKWVGEAERQLRLLFEEAKNSQPSIIFFDEIDGLAPVRSSKQDQIHASIVSTLLALMDGMDGRGQVVIIGATNRPDSVDPALRRPGRFDREFYFALPDREARKSIINIHTKEWDPPLEDAFKDKLAEVTKGYGGADLRALCTEAALNAIQRRYPQIYQTTERLELKPESIHVDARDFMMSVNKVVPSSARSASTAAAPLQAHLKPLLEQAVHEATQSLERVMPPTAKRNPLEEAQWEDDAPTTSDGGFGRELLMQSFEQLRIFRPRFVVHGTKGMGQRYVGAALLNHLEGYHVQTLDAGTLLGDSSTTMEAAIVQMFNESKRHKPSVLYIPSLAQWADTISDSARSTFRALLDSLAPSDPILLVAISESPFEHLPHDIRSWFGFTRENRLQLTAPDEHRRRAYFDELLEFVSKAPSEFPDGLPRRRRILEKLPIAAPRPPRQPTQAEIRQQAADDARLLEHLKFRLGPVLAELKKKFPRFKRDVWQEYNLFDLTSQFEWRKEKNKVIVTLLYEPGSQLLQRLQATSPTDERNGFRAGDNGQSTIDPLNGAEPSASQQDDVVASQASGIEASGFAQVQAQEQMEESRPGTPIDAKVSPRFNVNGRANSLSGLAAAMTGDFSTSNPPPVHLLPGNLGNFRRDESGFFVRDLPIWTVNLEKMQKRLYYNGYLTVTDFIDDLGRIVSNAEEAQEVDEERLTRAHQLRNLAVILIEQHIDADFRGNCERMAARMLQREEEQKNEAERVRKEQEEAARMPKGERHSARLHGEAPTESSLDQLAALERKRSRNSDGTARAAESSTNGVEDGDDGNKRMRMELDGGNEPSLTMPDASLAAGQLQGLDWHAPSATKTQPPAPAPLSHETNPYRLTNGSHPSSSTIAPAPPAATAHLIAAAVGSNESILSPIVRAAATPPAATTPHPPFTYDVNRMRQVREHLLSVTAAFSVEQLEHIRAALFNVIWSRRSEWDKYGLLSEMTALIDDVGKEVQTFNLEEKRIEEEELL